MSAIVGLSKALRRARSASILGDGASENFVVK
jgi:hypothetical protein